jgi:hypothetical protein
MTDEQWNEVAGALCFYLQDTHGIPKEIFIERISEGSYFSAKKIVALIMQYKDFKKKYLNKDWTLKK